MIFTRTYKRGTESGMIFISFESPMQQSSPGGTVSLPVLTGKTLRDDGSLRKRSLVKTRSVSFRWHIFNAFDLASLFYCQSNNLGDFHVYT